MTYYHIIIALLFFLINPANSLSQIIPIEQLHYNNSSGFPAAPYAEGTTVTVSGSITLGSGILSSSHTEAFLQDTTGGIMLYDADALLALQTGDSVTVSGSILHYLGNTAIKPDEIIKHGQKSLPQPLTLNCSDVQNAFGADYLETNESRLIQINYVEARNTSPFWTLFDSSGLCKMYLYPNSGITDPGNKFSVIGILMQRADTSPFTDSYVIMPRFTEDILTENPPKFISPITEIDIKSTEVTLAWTTDTKSTCLIEYGLTTGYESGQIDDTNLKSEHQVTLAGLTPATYYHCRVRSTNEFSTSTSGILFCTGSRSESTGKINVYFNKSVDHSVATFQQANGWENLRDKLCKRLRAAKYSIDVCIYSFTLDEVVAELIAAHNRGVSVRVIHENENANADTRRLADNGVAIINDTFGDNSGDSYMHNKFVIIDHRDTTSAADDWLWTGSFNFSYNATFRNAENAIEIQDEALAKCYTTEFNEMWGSGDINPDPALSRFGERKKNNTPHGFFINGVDIRPYFSPSDRIANQLELNLRTAQRSLYFCIYSFTQSGLAHRMGDQRAANHGFRLSGVFDNGQKTAPNSQWQTLLNWNPPADIWLAKFSGGGLMHHKYLIIDCNYTDSDPVLVTGSYNWSTSAEKYNDENILIIKDAAIANLYYQEFIERYHQSGGTGVDELAGESSQAHLPNQAVLYQNYPNPFNKTTEIQYSLRQPNSSVQLAIFNIAGQSVKTLFNGTLASGEYRCQWNAQTDAGLPVSSGIYFIRLQTERERHIRKIILLY